jgi:DnaK suppressor protein
MGRGTVNQLSSARERLLEQRAALQVQLGRLAATLSAATGSQALEGTLASHPADEASDMLEAEITLTRSREIQAEVRDIDEALSRIAEGTYGICVECGVEIDPARMRAQPLVTRCIRCETNAETAEWRAS